MSLSKEEFDQANFKFYVANTDPPIPEYDVVVRVTPKGYPWRFNSPTARVTIKLEGNKRPYRAKVVDITDYGGIGHHPQLKKRAREWFETRYGGLFRARG